MDEKNQLVQLLDDELVLHKAMIPLLDEEKSSLFLKKPDSLLAVLKKKQSLVDKIKEKEHQRQALVISLSLRLKVPQERITVSFLADYWREPALLTLKRTLVRVLEEIQTAQQLNSTLLRNAHNLIREAVAMMYAEQQQDPVYGPKGTFNDDVKDQGYFDKKI